MTRDDDVSKVIAATAIGIYLAVWMAEGIADWHVADSIVLTVWGGTTILASAVVGRAWGILVLGLGFAAASLLNIALHPCEPSRSGESVIECDSNPTIMLIVFVLPLEFVLLGIGLAVRSVFDSRR